MTQKADFNNKDTRLDIIYGVRKIAPRQLRGRLQWSKWSLLTCDVDTIVFNYKKAFHGIKMAGKVWNTDIWKAWDKHGKNDL